MKINIFYLLSKISLILLYIISILSIFSIYQKNTSSNSLFLLISIILIVIISSFVGILISSIIAPTEIDSLLNENIFRLKISQLIASFFIFIIPPVVLSYFIFNGSLNIFGFKREILSP